MAVRQTSVGRVTQMMKAMSGSEEKEGLKDGKVAADIDRYNAMHDDSKMDAKERSSAYAELVNSYYNLATDFYEWGWGQSFHFAEKLAGESFGSSIARHEYYLAMRLGLKPSDRVLDCGCGIGGPLCATARSNLAPLASAAARTHPRAPCAAAATSASSPARA